jgi:hypothetical protein
MPTLQWLDDTQARRAVDKVPYRMLRPDERLKRERVAFKQTPYDVRVR